MIGIIVEPKHREVIVDIASKVEVRDLINDKKNVMVWIEKVVYTNGYNEMNLVLKGTVFYMLNNEILKSFIIDTTPNWYLVYDREIGCCDLAKTEEEAINEAMQELKEACERLNVIMM